MAKRKDLKKFPLILEKVDWTPTRIVNGKKEELVNNEGVKVVKPIFQIKMSVLGRETNFKVYPKDSGDKMTLLDFFNLRKTDHLPVTLQEEEFKNAETGEIISSYSVLAKLSEEDDIHIVKLKPADDEKNRWKMAVGEILSEYKVPQEFLDVRKENYERAKAKHGSKAKKDDLPF